MRIAALDIETTPSPAGLERLLSKKLAKLAPPSTWKDPEKIAAYMEEKRAGMLADCTKTASLSALYGQVVSIAMEGPHHHHALTLGEVGSEKALLEWAVRILDQLDAIVTFNGAGFDVPFLRTRLLVHGLTVPACLEQRRYRRYLPHCDLRMALTDWDQYANGDLSEWCAALGVDCPGKDKGITGADVAPMAAAGRWQEIAEYNLGDAVATWLLLERCWPLVRAEMGYEGRTLKDAWSAPAPVASSTTTASTTTAEMEVW